MRPILKKFMLACLIVTASCNNDDKEKAEVAKLNLALDNTKYKDSIIISNLSRTKDTLDMIREGDSKVTTLFSQNSLPIARLVQAEAAVDKNPNDIIAIPHVDSSTGEEYWISVQKENPANKQLHDYNALQKKAGAIKKFVLSKEFYEETQKAQKQMNNIALDLFHSLQKGVQKSSSLERKNH